MFLTHAKLLVRLHTDTEGLVWFGDNEEPATNTFMAAEDFFEHSGYVEVLERADTIRLLGLAQNAALIVKLHEKKKAHSLFAHKFIELGAPAVVAPAWVTRNNSQRILQQLRQPPMSAQVSGYWHNLTPTDYLTYALVLASQNGQPLSDLDLRLLHAHPAWSALRFVSGVPKDAACRFICTVLNPRWYQHPLRPSRLSRLHTYLGLFPQNLQAFLGLAKPQTNYERAVNVIRLWYRSPHQADGVPGEFLMREYWPHREQPVKGLLRSSQLLVRLVSAVWTTTIESGPHKSVFDPTKFFTSAEDAAAFAKQLTLR